MIFTRAGINSLKFALFVLVAGLGVGAFIVVGSYWYWQAEKNADQLSQRSSQDLRGRLSVVKRDRDDLLGSQATYNALTSRGTFLTEQRFDLIEALAALKARHKLVSLAYEVAPQRPLRLAASGSFPGVNLFASRVKIKIRTLHDGDLIAFLDEFPRMQRGFFPIDRCMIKRGTETLAIATPALVTQEEEDAANAARRNDSTPVSRPVAVSRANTALEAECSLEWITLQAKDGKGASPLSAGASQNVRPL